MTTSPTPATFEKNKIAIANGRVVTIQLWTSENGNSYPYFSLERRVDEKFCLHRRSEKGSQPMMVGTLDEVLTGMGPTEVSEFRHACSLQELTKASKIPGFGDFEIHD